MRENIVFLHIANSECAVFCKKVMSECTFAQKSVSFRMKEAVAGRTFAGKCRRWPTGTRSAHLPAPAEPHKRLSDGINIGGKEKGGLIAHFAITYYGAPNGERYTLI